MNIAIVGSGYVGLVTGVCLAELGHQVLTVDIDADKVRAINAGESPFFEAGLDELLSRNLGHRFAATTDLTRAVQSSDVSFIAVGTPFDGNAIDLQFVRKAAEQIGLALRDHLRHHTVVVKSTVVPGTTDDIITPILESTSGRTAGADFAVATNPEFLSQGTAVSDFMNPDRVVIGANDEETHKTLRELYSAFDHLPRLETTIKAAEMIKYASNCLLATMISYANEIGNLCSTLGEVDAVDVFRGVHLSNYLSPLVEKVGRVRSPISSFLESGCGFGGSCLPKDTHALIEHARSVGAAMPLLSAVMEVNRQQPARMVDLLRRHFDTLAGVQVAVLGLAFKPETDDTRESPALPIIRLLLKAGAQVKAYDPAANTRAATDLADTATEICDTLDDALAGCDAVMVVTKWEEFTTLPDRLAFRDPSPVVIDGRRIIQPSAVHRYEGIGK